MSILTSVTILISFAALFAVYALTGNEFATIITGICYIIILMA